MLNAPLGEFHIYPRGFLGARLGKPVEKTLRPFEDVVRSHHYHVDMFNQPSPTIQVNANVEALYSQHMQGTGATLSFDFREKVLQVALEAFGTSDFKHWFISQHRSPATGDLHRRFLDDILAFIVTGRRNMALETWAALLTYSDIDGNITPLTPEVIDMFDRSFGKDQPVSLVDVMVMWCSQPNGIEDLLHTLHILFGNFSN